MAKVNSFRGGAKVAEDAEHIFADVAILSVLGDLCASA
jgi:hypothetical protein